MNSVYVIIALEADRVKECVVLTDGKVASTIFLALSEIYGNANVAFVSRGINDVPVVVSEYLAKSGRGLKTSPMRFKVLFIMRRVSAWIATRRKESI